jgi:phosphoribosylglycinamide formyltransferase-1
VRKKKIAIFASGSGTNAERIMSHFRDHKSAEVSIVLSNRSDAGVLARAEKHHVSSRVFDRETFYQSTEIPDLLVRLGIDLIVLAGFLWLIPAGLLQTFQGRIINIHPALLPKYGGKGMYGRHVHEAVLASGDKESGISIHYVNEVYDEGRIIFQARCRVEPGDTPETLAARIHQLEHLHYPLIIEELLKGTG